VRVAQPQDGSKHAQDVVLLVAGEPDDVHGVERLLKVRDIIDARHIKALRLARVRVGLGPLQAEVLALLGRRGLGELVEDVERALVADLADDARLHSGV
jgi:hypothetical protein